MDNKTNQRPVSKWLTGGTPKTTAEMETDSTFLDSDWDFVDETTNGTEDVYLFCIS
jgi:hypothetical protein